ncbi:MAG: D,D-dipeptide ABC transporter permease [Thermoproteota archaeon]|uniref:ABC transporter permease n=1 Tax=Candidatus Methanodesulfokora washburnensis TaxID=2478471 RepID=A0A520KNP5_9CREN|nr:MAG: ABC transporter permease [Candidatus Methanodesulfokores washburnensis]TDA39380.1 MAG: D,D-dipeptide ABC transporter permease [Candidatus Korarchaeota archaeon]
MFMLMRRNAVSMIGFIIVIVFLIMGIISPYILTKPEDAWGTTYDVSKRYLPPSLEHPFGTDEYGRDMFNRVILGARFSLIIAIGVVGLALVIGVPLGLIAGYSGGRTGTALMRITDMFLAFPPLLLAIALAATLGRGLENAILALAISWWPWYARLIYVQVNTVKSMPYVDAARVLGLGSFTIMFRHILPNALTPVVIQASLDMGSAVLEAAGLSFLGIGVQPPTPEWGLLVSQGWQSINVAWWISFFPGLAILVTVLGFNLLADFAREFMDPRLRITMMTKKVV